MWKYALRIVCEQAQISPRLCLPCGYINNQPGCVAQSVGHLTRKSGVLGSIPDLATYFHFSFRFFKKGSCQLLAKVCDEVLVNHLGGLSLPMKSVVRLTDRPNMTLDVYRGRKTMQQQQQYINNHCMTFINIFPLFFRGYKTWCFKWILF